MTDNLKDTPIDDSVFVPDEETIAMVSASVILAWNTHAHTILDVTRTGGSANTHCTQHC